MSVRDENLERVPIMTKEEQTTDLPTEEPAAKKDDGRGWSNPYLTEFLATDEGQRIKRWMESW